MYSSKYYCVNALTIWVHNESTYVINSEKLFARTVDCRCRGWRSTWARTSSGLWWRNACLWCADEWSSAIRPKACGPRCSFSRSIRRCRQLQPQIGPSCRRRRPPFPLRSCRRPRLFWRLPVRNSPAAPLPFRRSLPEARGATNKHVEFRFCCHESLICNRKITNLA